MNALNAQLLSILFFFTQRVQHDFIYFVRGAQLFVRYPAYMLPGYMPGASQRSTQHTCRVPHREVGPITSLGGTQHNMLGSSRLSQSTPITHADWLPIRNEEMLKKVKDKLINRACLLQRGWTHGAGHLTDICIYRLKRDGYRNGIHDRYLFLNLYNFLQKNKSHVADDLSASE